MFSEEEEEFKEEKLLIYIKKERPKTLFDEKLMGL